MKTLGFALTFLLAQISNLLGAGDSPLTDFEVKLTWRTISDVESLKPSARYRYYHSPRVYLYICDSRRLDLSKHGADFIEVRDESQTQRVPDVDGCLAMPAQFRFDSQGRREGRDIGYPLSYDNHRGGTIDYSAVAHFSATEFYRMALHQLKVKEIEDAVLVLGFWRYGTNLVHNNVMEFLDIRAVDFMSFSSEEASPKLVYLEASTTLGKSVSSKAVIEGSFAPVHVPDSSPYYDLNVPLEIYRPTIVRTLLGRKKTEPLTLYDYLILGDLYFSFQKDPIWKQLSGKLSEIDLQAQSIGEFLKNDRVHRTTSMATAQALNVYLYYYRANLEDVNMRLVSVQEKLKQDPSSMTMVDGRLVISNEAQERLARYQLTQMQVRDSILLFDAVTQAGRSYLDQILR